MENKPYHHLPDGSFRNPEGSPERNSNFKWSFKIFNKEKKKLDMNIPDAHVVEKQKVLFENVRHISAYKGNLKDSDICFIEKK